MSKNGFIVIEGHNLEIACRMTNPDRPTLVFLHEGLGCVQMWRDFPETIAAATRCNLLVYSRLGYGASDPAALPRRVSYMHDEGLKVLPAVLTKLNVGKHILIGHSDGGSIALINGGGIRSGNLLGIITEAAHVFNEDLSVKSIAEAKIAYQTTGLRAKLAKHHAHVDNAFWGWNDIWLHPDFRQWNIEEYLPLINVPVLAIQGVDDQYGTLAQVEAIVTGVGGSVEKQLIPDCMHTPHKEQPEVTSKIVIDFIKRQIGLI